MKYSEFSKKELGLQKEIINAIMNYTGKISIDDCDEYGSHDCGLNHQLLKNVSDVSENQKWNVIAAIANAFTTNGHEDLAGLFPAWESEWFELNEIWWEHESDAGSKWSDETE